MIRLARRPVRYGLLAAMSTGALLVSAAPASAAPQVVDLNCTTIVTTDIHPGVTTELGHFTVHSNGFTGTSICTGTVDGEPVTGPGAFLINENVIGNCFGAMGFGSFVLKIPTVGGIQTVSGHFELTSTFPTGTVHTGDLSGTSRVIARLEGDCLNTPATRSIAELIDHIT